LFYAKNNPDLETIEYGENGEELRKKLRQEYIEIIGILLKNGADINFRIKVWRPPCIMQFRVITEKLLNSLSIMGQNSIFRI